MTKVTVIARKKAALLSLEEQRLIYFYLSTSELDLLSILSIISILLQGNRS
jgi:hypothetical protein